MTTSLDTTSTPNPTVTNAASGITSPKADQQLEAPQILPFPSPQTFTFLPQLYTLVSRLAPLQSQSHSRTQSQVNGTPSLRPSRSPTLTRRPVPAPSGAGIGLQTATVDGTAPLSLTQTRSREEAIEIKDLPALSYPLRQQIDSAKEAVRQLPDVGRTISEQEDEIRELEARIEGTKSRLEMLSVLAAEDGAAGPQAPLMEKDVAMQGVES